MKKIVGLAILIAFFVVIVPYARSLGMTPLPPGIERGSWIPMGDSAGFVIHKEDRMGSASPNGTVTGYFMVRRSGAWLRIDPAPEYGVHPAMH